jgi:hypothetical protein
LPRLEQSGRGNSIISAQIASSLRSSQRHREGCHCERSVAIPAPEFRILSTKHQTNTEFRILNVLVIWLFVL